MTFSGSIETATEVGSLAEIGELAYIIWNEHYPAIIGQAQVDYMLARGYTSAELAAEQTQGSRFLLARSAAGAAIGFAAWTPDATASDTSWLDKLYVLQAARQGGVARALIEHIDNTIPDGWLKLRVNRHNSQSIAAYERLGFCIAATDIKNIGDGFVMDDYIMQRPVQYPGQSASAG